MAAAQLSEEERKQLEAEEQILKAQLQQQEIEALKAEEAQLKAELGMETTEFPVESEEARLAYAQELEGKAAPTSETLSDIAEEKSGLETVLDYMGRPGAATRSAILATREAGPLAGAKAFGEAIQQPSEIAPTETEALQMLGVPRQVEEFAAPAMPTGLGLGLEREAPESLGTTDPTKSLMMTLPFGMAADISTYVPAKAITAPLGFIAKQGLAAGAGAIAGTGYLLGKGAARAAKDVAEIGGTAISPQFGKASKEAIAEAIDAAKTKGPEVVRVAVSAYRDALNPSLQESFEKAVDLAVKNGIDPALLPFSVKYGPNSFIEKVRKFRAQTSVGPEFENHQIGLKQVTNAVELDLYRLGKDTIPPDPIQAGQNLLEGYQRSVSNLFDQNKLRYSNIIDQLRVDTVPEATRKKLLQSLDAKIKGIDSQLEIALSETRPTLQATKADLEGIRKYLGGERPKPVEAPGFFGTIFNKIREFFNMSPGQEAIANPDPVGLSGLIVQMQELGKIAFSSPKYSLGSAYSDRRVLKDTYKLLNDALMETVESSGSKEARQVLEASNKAQSQFLKQNELVEKVFNNPKIAPENIYKSLIESGDTKQLRALVEIFGRDSKELKSAGTAWLNRQLRKNAFDQVEYPQTLKALQRSDQMNRLKTTLFTPEELKDFEDLIQLGSDFGSPILNPSGTAVTQQVKEVLLSPVAAMGSFAVSEALIRNAEKQAALRLARQKQGKLTPAVASELARMIGTKGNNPTVAEDIIEGLRKSTEKTGIGFSMSPTPTEMVAKSMMVLGRVYKQNPDFGPVFIPEPFRAEVIKQVMADPSLSPLEKARNKFSLETNGYILKVGAGTSMKEAQAEVKKNLSLKAIQAEKPEGREK